MNRRSKTSLHDFVQQLSVLHVATAFMGFAFFRTPSAFSHSLLVLLRLSLNADRKLSCCFSIRNFSFCFLLLETFSSDGVT